MESFVARIGRYPHTEALFESPLQLPTGSTVLFERTAPGSVARQMIRELRYDICELPVVNYLSSREHGVQFTALPVFLTRRFPHATLVCNRALGIELPKDLEGKRIGVGYYGNTDTTWAQGVLLHQFGVDLASVTFVTSQEEQVPGVTLPPNVTNVTSRPDSPTSDGLPGPILTEMLVAKKLEAVIYGLPPAEMPSPEIEPLFPDLAQVERAWYDETEVFPVLHTVVVKTSLIQAIPNLAGALMEAFESAKQSAFERLETDAPMDEERALVASKSGFPIVYPPSGDRSFLGIDPIPYGVEANRHNLELLIAIARERHIMSWHPAIEDLFDAGES